MTDTSLRLAPKATVSDDHLRRGLSVPGHPTIIGSFIGTGGATAFVLANRSLLGDPGSQVALVAWALALAVFAWAVLLRRRALIDPPRPRRGAGLVYLGGVVGMLAVMSLGRLVLEARGHAELQPALVVVAVGLHFVPFAWAFGVPVFAWLGWSLAAVGALGLSVGVVTGSVVPVAFAAVGAGVVMLLLMALATRTVDPVSS